MIIQYDRYIVCKCQSALISHTTIGSAKFKAMVASLIAAVALRARSKTARLKDVAVFVQRHNYEWKVRGVIGIESRQSNVISGSLEANMGARRCARNGAVCHGVEIESLDCPKV
jgi:hypothetical protein